MAGPWDNYSNSSSDSQSGPWSNYQAPAESPSAPDSGFLTQAGKSILGDIGKVGQTIDSYGGAPTRAAIASLQDNPTDLSGAASAFKNQFGANPALAPTGKDIAAKAGLSTEPILSPENQDIAANAVKVTPFGFIANKVAPGSVENVAGASPAGVAGLGVDVAADPMTYLPMGKAAEAVAGTAARQAGNIGKAANAVGEIASSAGTKVTSKVGSMLTGIPEQEVETYISKYPAVQKLIAEHGDEIASGGADQIRQGFQNSIRAKVAELGKQVNQALSALPDEKNVPIAPVVDALNDVKNGMNFKLRYEEVRQVQDLINRLHWLADNQGKVTPKEMFDIKQFLQDRGASSYMKDGQMFVPGKDAQLAAKKGAAQARDIVNTMSPTVADANNQLYQLHVLQDKMNGNLIAPGTPDTALVGAGSGTNPRGVAQLQQLGQATGQDLLGQAQIYAAAKRFASPGLSSADTTGKGVERALKAGIVGQALGGPIAAGIAAGITSPMALKLGIQAGKIPVGAIQKIAGVTGELSDATIQRAYDVLKTPGGQAAFNAALQGAKTESIVNPPKLKGEDLWAQQGMQKIGINDPGLANRLVQNPMAKKLLIQASDLKPGTAAMKNIIQQLQKGYGLGQ